VAEYVISWQMTILLTGAEMVSELKGIFNSPLEAGLRCLVILNSGYPNNYDLGRLVFYDYILVHSADVDGGPESLHPATPHRSGEILIRRPILEAGLKLMISRGLVKVTYCGDGIFYSASEDSTPFIDCLSSRYICELDTRSQWVVDTFDAYALNRIQDLVNRNIVNWGGEFISESLVRGGVSL
jgi:hypothetical protein